MMTQKVLLEKKAFAIVPARPLSGDRHFLPARVNCGHAHAMLWEKETPPKRMFYIYYIAIPEQPRHMAAIFRCTPIFSPQSFPWVLTDPERDYGEMASPRLVPLKAISTSIIQVGSVTTEF